MAIHRVDSPFGSRWLACSLAHKRKYGSLYTGDHAAAIISAGHCISRRVDGSVCAYGHRCCPCQPGCGKPPAEQSTEYFCRAAGGQFLLEFVLFQYSGLWFFLSMAAFVDRAGVGYGLYVLESRPPCRNPAASIFALGYFCILSEFWCLASEPSIIRAPVSLWKWGRAVFSSNTLFAGNGPF